MQRDESQAIKIKVLVNTLYITIIASTIFAFVAYKIRSGYDEDMQNHVSSNAMLLAKYTARSLDNIQLTIKHIAQHIEYDWSRGIAPSAQMRPLLKWANDDLHHVRSINIVNQKGYLFVDTLKIHEQPMFVGDRDYYIYHYTRDNSDFIY